MRSNNSFYSTSEVSREPNRVLPGWLNRFVNTQIENQQKQAVESINKQPSIYEMMSSIFNPNGKSKYSSVEEAVLDYQKRTGLTKYLEQTSRAKLEKAAGEIISTASVAEEEEFDFSMPMSDSDFDEIYSFEEEELPTDKSKITHKLEGEDLEEYLKRLWLFTKNDKNTEAENLEYQTVDDILSSLDKIEQAELSQLLQDAENDEIDFNNAEDFDIDNILQMVENLPKCDNERKHRKTTEINIDDIMSVINNLTPIKDGTEETDLSDDLEYTVDDILSSLESLKSDSNDVRWDDKKKILVTESNNIIDSFYVVADEDLPEILKQYPAIKSYITNMIDTNYGIEIPALLHSIAETFSRDGITQNIVFDKDLAIWINKQLLAKNNITTNTSDYSNLGRGLGLHSDVSSENSKDDPFKLLTPNKNSI